MDGLRDAAATGRSGTTTHGTAVHGSATAYGHYSSGHFTCMWALHFMAVNSRRYTLLVYIALYACTACITHTAYISPVLPLCCLSHGRRQPQTSSWPNPNPSLSRTQTMVTTALNLLTLLLLWVVWPRYEPRWQASHSGPCYRTGWCRGCASHTLSMVSEVKCGTGRCDRGCTSLINGYHRSCLAFSPSGCLPARPPSSTRSLCAHPHCAHSGWSLFSLGAWLPSSARRFIVHAHCAQAGAYSAWVPGCPLTSANPSG